jgi:CheY-like chemotaxis protein
MARVLALIPDLLFGSNVQGQLRAGGHEVALVGSESQAHAGAAQVDVLVVDLASGQIDGPALLARLRDADALGRARTLAFYSHVEADIRAGAERAGYDLVVARSRMAREGAALVSRLAGESPDAAQHGAGES